jgi:PAS domain S-box-containing protein
MFSIFPNNREKKNANAKKESEQERKVAESQTALLTAAMATADMAQEVTVGLKKRLDDIIKQFESTVRVLRDGLVICTESGTILTFNPAAERLFGVKAGAVLRKSVLTLFERAADDTPLDVRSLWAILQNEDQEDVLGTRNGSTFPARITLTNLDRSDGSRVVLLLIHDATENAQVPRDRRYQDIFESSFDGIVVVTEDGNLLAMNQSLSRMFGYPSESLVGMTISDLVVERDRHLIRACYPRHDTDDAPGLPQHFSVEGKHASGMHLSLLFTLTNITWDSKPATLATIKDVTELRRIETMIAMKRDNGIDMVVCYDPTLRITFANDTFAKSVGFQRRDLNGVDIRTLMSDAGAASLLASVSKVSARTPVSRTQTRDGDILIDWVDHGHFDIEGRPVEFQRTGRHIKL